MHGGSGELFIARWHCRCVEVLGRLGSAVGGVLVSALPENWCAAVKWQCVGVFLPVTLPGVCDLSSAERAFCNLHCPWGVNRAVQRGFLHFVLPAVCDSGSTEGQFCNLYCL